MDGESAMRSTWRGAKAATARVLGRKPRPRLVLPDLRRLQMPELHAPEIDWARGRRASRAGAMWPTLAAAAGAGVAFWWWNQWARGRAEAEGSSGAGEAAPAPAQPSLQRRAMDAAGAQEGAQAPEAIMAHAPPPAPLEAGAEGASPARKGAGRPNGAAPSSTLPPEAQAGLDESLAVQASATPPKRRSRPRDEASE